MGKLMKKYGLAAKLTDISEILYPAEYRIDVKIIRQEYLQCIHTEKPLFIIGPICQNHGKGVILQFLWVQLP
jgi:hypothetical protein